MSDLARFLFDRQADSYDYGLMIDCEANGCEQPHGDNGMVLPRGNQEPVIERINGHIVTTVVRTVTYSEWRPVARATSPGVIA